MNITGVTTTTETRLATSAELNDSKYWPSDNDTNSAFSRSGIFVPCNNNNVLDKDTASEVERLLTLTVFPLLEFSGVITNVINCLVFIRHGLRDRINLCLFTLALADISFLSLIFSAKFYSFLGLWNPDWEEYWRQRYLNTVLAPMLASQIISSLMTLIISVERCICVVSPFTAKRFLKTRYTAIGIVTMVIYILGFYSLLDLKYVTRAVTDPVTRRTQWVSCLSAFYLKNRVLVDLLYNHMLGLTIPCLSLLIVVVTTSITVSKLRSSQTWRKSIASQPPLGEKREAAVTKMLTVVCFIYVITITPSVTQTFFRALVPGYLPTGKFCNLFTVVQTIAHVLEVLNSSVNFGIYYTMGSKFRLTVRKMAQAAACLGQERSAGLQSVCRASQDTTRSALCVFTVSHDETASSRSVSTTL